MFENLFKHHKREHVHRSDRDLMFIILSNQYFIIQKLNEIMSTQEEAAAALRALKDQLVKANTEIQAKIQALIDAAGNADQVNPELQAAIDDLKPAAQALDDIVPDGETGGGTTEG